MAFVKPPDQMLLFSYAGGGGRSLFVSSPVHRHVRQTTFLGEEASKQAAYMFDRCLVFKRHLRNSIQLFRIFGAPFQS